MSSEFRQQTASYLTDSPTTTLTSSSSIQTIGGVIRNSINSRALHAVYVTQFKSMKRVMRHEKSMNTRSGFGNENGGEIGSVIHMDIFVLEEHLLKGGRCQRDLPLNHADFPKLWLKCSTQELAARW